MTESRIVKKQARDFLRGNWGPFVVAFFLLFIPIAIAQCVETCVVFFGIKPETLNEGKIAGGVDILIVSLFSLLGCIIIMLFSPLVSGLTKISFELVNGRTPYCADLFYFFRNGKYRNTLCFNFSLLLRKLFWFFIFLIPAFVLKSASHVLNRMNDDFKGFLWATNLLGVLFLIIGVAVALCFTAKFFPAGYLYVESDGERKAGDIISHSACIMRGNTSKYFTLCLSFIPWLLFSLLILPGMYSLPYICVSFANSAKWIINLSNQQLERRYTNGLELECKVQGNVYDEI